MLFLKPILVFCATAILLALVLDGSLLAVTRLKGSAGLWATPFGWVLIFATVWGLALVLGIFLARMLHIFPLYNPMG